MSAESVAGSPRRGSREHIRPFLEQLIRWAEAEPRVRAIALVGSHARGTARADSDIDLVILATDPDAFLSDTAWARRFGHPDRMGREDWGGVISVRVFYDFAEVEFGFARLSWAQTSPIDPGTRDVVMGGLQTLYDPDSVLGDLLTAIETPI